MGVLPRFATFFDIAMNLAQIFDPMLNNNSRSRDCYKTQHFLTFPDFRKHNNIVAILVLNLVLGWTFLGWLAALLWSLNSDVQGSED